MANLSLNLVWSCLNTLQLIVYSPLSAVKYPANAYSFNEPLQKVASFDLLDELDIMNTMMYYPEVGALNLNFETIGFDSLYFNLNIGTLFFIIVSYLLSFAILGLLYLFSFIK